MHNHKQPRRKRPVSFDQMLYGAGNVDYNSTFNDSDFGDGNLAPKKQVSSLAPEVLVSGAESKSVSTGGTVYNQRTAPTVSRETYYDEDWANWAMSLDTPGKHFGYYQAPSIPYEILDVQKEEDEGGYDSIWDFIESAISGTKAFGEYTKEMKESGDMVLDNIGEITEENYKTMGFSDSTASKVGKIGQVSANASVSAAQSIGNAMAAEVKSASLGTIGVSPKTTAGTITAGMEAAESAGMAAGRGMLLAI